MREGEEGQGNEGGSEEGKWMDTGNTEVSHRVYRYCSLYTYIYIYIYIHATLSLHVYVCTVYRHVHFVHVHVQCTCICTHYTYTVTHYGMFDVSCHAIYQFVESWKVRRVRDPALPVSPPEQHVFVGQETHHLVAVLEPSEQNLHLATLQRCVKNVMQQ